MLANTTVMMKTQTTSLPDDKYKPQLFALISVLSFVLFMMIVFMILPMQYQNCIMELFSSKVGKFSYIDIGLYKTRHSMYRKEVYQHEMSKSNNSKKSSKNLDELNAKLITMDIELPTIVTTIYDQSTNDVDEESGTVLD